MNPIKRVKRHLARKNDLLSEIIWADVWHDTMRGIDWMQDLGSISPGRSAVGYNYLYVMTRILNELQPIKVLDIGLGISTSLISNYFDHKKVKGGYHYILEHDEAWASFYTAKHNLSSESKIIIENMIIKKLNGQKYYAYSHLDDEVINKKYEVVSIDAPFGKSVEAQPFLLGGGGKYSRRDVIEYIPDILCESFVILIDDYNRFGEQKTAEDIKIKLTQAGIPFATGVYMGTSHLYVIASENNKFFCSL